MDKRRAKLTEEEDIGMKGKSKDEVEEYEDKKKERQKDFKNNNKRQFIENDADIYDPLSPALLKQMGVQETTDRPNMSLGQLWFEFREESCGLKKDFKVELFLKYEIDSECILLRRLRKCMHQFLTEIYFPYNFTPED